jgi:hypothetical protein
VGIRNPTQGESAQEKEFATGGAAAITKKLDSSYDLAKNSVERITTINDLKSVIDLPAFSGPGATTQLLLGQLANKFYGDSTLWWIIASANGLGKGTIVVPRNSKLRIPSDKNIQQLINILNNSR